MWKIVILLFFGIPLVFFSQKRNATTLKPFNDTLLFSKIPVKVSTFSNINLSPTCAEIVKDSSHVKSIYFKEGFPINRKKQPHVEITCAEIDTHIIQSFSGTLYLENLTNNFTFFNPIDDIENTETWEVPNSAIYYQNPSKVQVDLDQFQLTTTEVCNNNLNEYFQPFFFQNEEVTNLMYRQFIYYVRDSIARTILAGGLNLNIYDWQIPTYDSLDIQKDPEDWILNWETKLDWEKYSDNEQFEYLAEMYLGESDRFYDRLQLDTRKILYFDTDTSNYYYRINIYPDTLCWIHDFEEPKVEVNTNMYTWHPAFDDFPVVGVDWHQAKAFCSWITKEANKYLRQNDIPYKVKYDLPSMIQWDYVRKKSMESHGMKIPPSFNWETNLVLNEVQSIPLNDSRDTTYKYDDFFNSKGKLTRSNLLNSPLTHNSYISNYKPLLLNGSVPVFLTRSYDLKKKQKKFPTYDVSNVKYLGTSVSEWLQESYEENWKLMYYKRMELLIKSSGADTDIQALREEYFNAYNHPQGRLVIGANWYDYRDEYYEGKTFESMDAKVFADPEKGYATVGFRMIATFEPLEE